MSKMRHNWLKLRGYLITALKMPVCYQNKVTQLEKSKSYQSNNQHKVTQL